MDKYLLTLMVTFEQEYAIQKLFGRHGWEYSKIICDISLEKIASGNTISSVNQLFLHTKTDIHVPTKIGKCDNKRTADAARDLQETVPLENAINTPINNILDNSITQGGDEDDNDDEYGGDTVTEESLNSLGINIKEEVECDNKDNILEHNPDSVSKTSCSLKNSGKAKRVAQCKLKLKSLIKNRRKENNSFVINAEVDKDKSEVKIEELSAEDKEIAEPLAVLEKLPDIEDVSKVVSPGFETFQTGPSDVSDTGYSATLSAYFCKDCQDTFPEEKFYSLHKRSGKCVFPCQSCDKKFTFKNLSKYQEHLKQHRHTATNRSHSLLCKECGKHFKRKSALKEHERRHEGDAPYKCCEKVFFSKANFNRHRCNVHGETKSYKCKLCGKGFPTNADLQRHVTRERKEFTIQCEICGFCEESYAKLADHMAKHNGSRIYRCQVCYKSFKYRTGLSRHIVKKHKGRKKKI